MQTEQLASATEVPTGQRDTGQPATGQQATPTLDSTMSVNVADDDTERIGTELTNVNGRPTFVKARIVVPLRFPDSSIKTELLRSMPINIPIELLDEVASFIRPAPIRMKFDQRLSEAFHVSGPQHRVQISEDGRTIIVLKNPSQDTIMPLATLFGCRALADTVTSWRIRLQTKYIWAVGVANANDVRNESVSWWPSGLYALYRDGDIGYARSLFPKAHKTVQGFPQWSLDYGRAITTGALPLECTVKIQCNHQHRSVSVCIESIQPQPPLPPICNIDIGVLHDNIPSFDQLVPVLRMLDGQATILDNDDQ
jgi:hypothetical protein